MPGESQTTIGHDHGPDEESRLLKIVRAMGATAGTIALLIAEASSRLPLAHHPDDIRRRHPRG